MDSISKMLPPAVRDSSGTLDYWRNFFEELGSSAWIWNLSTDQVEFTSSWLNSMGYHSDELQTGTEWFSMLHPEDAKSISDLTNAYVAGQSDSLDIEFRFRKKDGSYRWLNSRAKIITPNDTQGSKYFFGLYTDITKLKEFESRWNNALEGSGVGVWEWDIESGELYWSPEFFRIVKLDETNTQPKLETWYDLVVPEHRVRNQHLLEQYLTGNNNQYRDEHQITRGDGSRVWILTRGTVTKRANTGKPLSMVGTLDDISVRKKQEKELQNSHERIRRVTSTIPGFVYEHHLRPDGTHYFPYTSEGIKNIYNITPAEVVSDTNSIHNATHPDDVSTVERTIRNSAESGEPWQLQYRIIRPDNEVRTIHGFANRRPTLEPDGTAVWFGYVNDVTEEVRAARRGEQIAQLVPGALFQYTVWPDGRHCFPYSTKGMGEFFGVPDEAMAENGDIPMGALHPEDIEETFKNVRECAERGIGWNLEYRVVVNGKTRWHHATTNILDEISHDGSVTWNGYLNDVTETKEKELRISEQHQLLNKVTKTIPGVICQYVIAENGVVRAPFLSDGVFDMFGVTRQSVQENAIALWTYIHPDDKPALGEIIANRQELDIEYRVLLPKIGEQWRRSLGTCVIGQDGTAIYYSYTLDATERKQNELAIKRQSDAISLANQDLEQFNYVAAHDLKEPLRAIKHLSEWIEEDLPAELNESVADNLKRMRARVERLQLLVDDLAAYSRAGRQGFETGPVNLLSLAQRIFADVEHLDCKLEISGVEDIEIATAEVALETVLKNLVNNAAQHRDENSLGEITIRSKTDEYFVTCSVEDDGPGIAAEHHERVFRMYQRLNPEADSTRSGSGLTIVRRIIGAAHGNIILESPLTEDGRGTRFTFKWPVNWPKPPTS